MKNIKILFVFSIIKLFYQEIASFFLNSINTKIIESQTDNKTNDAIFFGSVIFAPIFETFISQILIYRIPVSNFRLNEKIFFHLSAILFGLAHIEHPLLMITLIPAGYIYVILYKKLLPNVYVAFFGVVFVHALSNLIAYWYDNF